MGEAGRAGLGAEPGEGDGSAVGVVAEEAADGDEGGDGREAAKAFCRICRSLPSSAVCQISLESIRAIGGHHHSQQVLDWHSQSARQPTPLARPPPRTSSAGLALAAMARESRTKSVESFMVLGMMDGRRRDEQQGFL